ncbi:MAG: DUF3800 domain-containing protein [Eggerthellales bacterium]|nr:DUF3800 domain-containing protein [Eggerthellales bacterium]
MANEVFNVYCDESCHLENDGQPVMGLGAVLCPARYASEINHELKSLKSAYGMPANYELKWTKVGKSKMSYYRAVIDLFARYGTLRFRGYIIDKSTIDHSLIPGQTHDVWYYKMYYKMLKPVVESDFAEYRIYVDIKDTRGFEKTQELKRILGCGVRDYCGERITRIQEVRSHEVELLQLADFILGAVVYENRGKLSSKAKVEVIEYLKEATGYSDLTHATSYRSHKMNLWMWEGTGR